MVPDRGIREMEPLISILLLLSNSWYVVCRAWSVTAPESVTGAEDLCLVIPCTFQHPLMDKETLEKVMWLHEDKVDGEQVISSDGTSHSRFQGRTEFIGNWRQKKDCSLKIKNLQQGDEGIYHFRMKFSNGVNFSDPQGVSLKLTDVSGLTTILPRGEMMENTEVNILCSVKYLCPGFLRWVGISGLNRSSSRQIDGTLQNGWDTGVELSFVTSYRDNARTLTCEIQTAFREIHAGNITLNVQYAPKLVYIDSSDYTQSYEGGGVTLTCMISNSNPPVTRYRWRGESGVRLYGITYQKTFSTSAVRQSFQCEATNSVGTTVSDYVSLVKLSDNNWGVWSPLVVRALKGSCVVIPCRFHDLIKETDSGEKIGKWLKGHHYNGDQVYHSTEDSHAEYNQRVQFLGNMDTSNCTLKINNLKTTDSGQYYFRIEMGSYKWSQKTASRLLVADIPEKPVIIPTGTMVEDQVATVTCSVQIRCPEDIPTLQWDIPFTNNQTETTSSYRENAWIQSRRVTFTPRFQDRDQTVRCKAQFGQMGMSAENEMSLNLQYKPRNISIALDINGKTGVQTMKEGDFVTLRCDALISNPAVNQYTWHKPEIRYWSSSGQTLEFRSISYTDYGKYYCKAGNYIGSNSSENIELQGQYAPRDFDISYMVNNEKVTGLFNIKEKDWLNITCSSRRSNPPVTRYSWLKNGEYLRGATQTLLFSSITKQDRGQYYCQARNDVGLGKSNPVSINVQYPPTDVRIDSPASVRDGGYVTLTCQFDANPTTYSIAWIKECDSVSSDLCRYSSSCGFTASLDRVHCVYYCTARNSLGEQKSGPKQLNIVYKPRSVRIISDTTVKDGTQITLTCQSEANPPANTFQWRKRCNRNVQVLRGTSQSIRITMTSDDELCDYFCRAQNNIGVQDSETKRIIVQYGPKEVEVKSNKPLGQIREGDHVWLECASRSNPQSHYTWYKDSTERGIAESREKTFSISPVSVSNAGKYYCRVENIMGSSLSKPLTIDVLYTPRNTKVLVWPRNDVIWKGDNITLTCRSDSNPPVDRYKWILDRGGSRMTLPVYGKNLTLSGVTGNDKGVYSCEARNQLGAHQSKGYKLDVHKNNIKLIVIIIVLLLVILFMVISAVLFYRRRKRNGDSISQQRFEATNTVYSVVMKRNRAKETTVYENMVMADSMENQVAPPFAENVEYASINFTYKPSGEGQKEAIRRKRKKTPKVNCDNDPSVVYSLVQKDPSASKPQASDDYENVGNLFKGVAESSDDEVNYTSIVHINQPGKRIQRQDSMESTEYTDIRF
ncbi:B-cell receptor CD22-like [Mustelus asterias]